MTVRVRFAPSPTGYLHIGGARTALFNWLFARQKKGTFILRIEDTDLDRSSPEMVEGILEGLGWLGLDWDEGPYYQSQRLDLYSSVCEKLLKEEKTYRCFCRRQLPEDGKAKTQSGGAWRCHESCRTLTEAEIQDHLHSGQPFALRFRVPKGRTVGFQDAVLGPLEVKSSTIEDFVILRSDGSPTYHLSVVADDAEMRVSHVIRGADHLANTSKQVLIYEALGQPLPSFAHLPLILGPDRKRLSKRHGATSVMEYRKDFLAAAVNNYLALLGWSAGGDEEFFTVEELIQIFDVERINKANSVFDPTKLEWMNTQYISRLPASELAPEVKPILQDLSLWNPSFEEGDKDTFLATIGLLKSHLRKLSDIGEVGRPFLTDEFDYEPEAVQKYLSFPEASQANGMSLAIRELCGSYEELTPFDLDSTERALRDTVKAQGLKSGQLIGAVRVALTGKSVAPGIFDVIVTLGKQRTVERLNRLLKFLQ